jgi:hypothetical protein
MSTKDDFYRKQRFMAEIYFFEKCFLKTEFILGKELKL